MNSHVTSVPRATIPAPMLNPGRPWIRTTFQLSTLIPSSRDNVGEKFANAYKCVLYWVNDRLPDRLPAAAWDGGSFRVEWPGQKVEVISISDIGVWSFRFEHPDMPYGDRAAVPGRVWTTDITLSKGAENIAVGVRSFCASLPYSGIAEVAMTRPRVVVELATRLGLNDQRPLSRDPWFLETENDLHRLRELLANPRRQLPVIVLTQPDRTRLNIQVSDYVLHPGELANRTLGLAHIVLLPWELGYKWTEMVGRPWSVYLGAVRTYMPGLDWENDAPAHHPSTFAEKIIFWKNQEDNRVGEGPFTDFLVERLFQQAASKRMDWGSLLFIAEARTKLAEVARSKAGEASDWKQLYEDQIAALSTKITELEKEAEEYNDDAMRATQDRDNYKDENRQLRYQVDWLRQALSDRTGGKSETEIPIPNNYDEMPDWVVTNLTGRLVLHPRALRGLRSRAKISYRITC